MMIIIIISSDNILIYEGARGWSIQTLWFKRFLAQTSSAMARILMKRRWWPFISRPAGIDS